MLETLIDVFRNTLMITSFVIVIMLIIELLNVFTQGTWSHWLNHYKSLQVIIGSLLGLIPGCFGGFAVVGMWTHGAISFGSLVAAMISSVGDEGFVMLVQMPEKALFMFGILFVIAIAIGLLIDGLGLNIKLPNQMKQHLVLHEHEQISLKGTFHNWKSNFKQPSFTRILLITGVVLFILGMVSGYFEHDHASNHLNQIRMPFEESWFNSIFLGLATIVLFTFLFVNDHFLDEHLWKHIIKQHVPKIALWTFGALLFIAFFVNSTEMLEWVKDNPFLIVLIAVLVGIVPESGPHLVFVTLFVSGGIPFSVLLANSITQDGHSSLPLLAESKKGFLATKLINVMIGLLVGYSGFLFGF